MNSGMCFSQTFLAPGYSSGRCVSMCAFFGKSCKHTFPCRKIYSVEEKRCLQFCLAN